MQANVRQDPVRTGYFRAVEVFEGISDWLFLATAVFSCLVFFIDKAESPYFYGLSHGAFAVLAISLFGIGTLLKIYLIPRAEDARRQDFISNAFGVPLSHKLSIGYYNNNLTDPIRRAAAQLLENSFFSKSISIYMARNERLMVAGYMLVWLLALLYRSTDIGLVAIASQVVFSEQILSRWLRLESLRMRYERTYDEAYRLLQSKAAPNVFRARVFEIFGFYETAKVSSGIILSAALFEKLNPELSKEWEEIKVRLGL